MWCKQVPITYKSLGLLQRNKDFRTPLEQTSKDIILLLCPSFAKEETFKKFTELFQQNANMHPMYSMLYTYAIMSCFRRFGTLKFAFIVTRIQYANIILNHMIFLVLLILILFPQNF